MSARICRLDAFLALLEGVKPQNNGQYLALCPGHPDTNPSLSVKEADDKILVQCFAGCELADILKPLNLEPKDLFLNSHKADTKPEHRTIEAVYHYDGFEVVRTRPKGFYQRKPDGKGGYINNLKGVTLSLYHQDKLREAIDNGAPIFVVEGEKDTDNVRKLGMAATCNPMGAGKWRDSYSEAFRGADLIIIPDADGPGRDHAAQVARSCYGKAVKVRVLELPGAKDTSDWLAIGHTADELIQIANQCSDYEPPADTTLPIIAVGKRQLRDLTSDGLKALEATNKPKPDTEQPAHFNPTDYGNAERLVTLYGDVIRYSPERKAWLIWTGKVWEWDMGGVKIATLAKKTARNIYREAADEPDDDKRKELANHARATEHQVRLDATIKSAESEPGMAVSLADLDANHWLLNVSNGTIDLRIGVLKPHDRADLITELLPIDYDLYDTSTEWDTFLHRIFNDNVDLIVYVQRTLGYSITGDQSEQVFFFRHGSGFNGKPTLLNACRLVMGNYATQMPPTAFMVDKTKHSGPDEAISSLKNKRLVCSTELEDGQRLSVSLMKRMTGGEPLWCEHKFERGYNFQPTHKLWLSGNHEPIITDTTNSIWFRLKKIPFTVEIPEADRKKGYAEFLAREHGAAILAWLVRGCTAWREDESLGEPEVVKQAVAEYRENQDILHDFLIERCIFQKNVTIDQKALYADYTKWAEENEFNAIGKLTFRTRIQEKGALATVGNRNVRIWRGIRLLTSEDDVNSVNSVNDFSESSLHEASHGKTLVKMINKINTSKTDNTGGLPDYPAPPAAGYAAVLGMPVEVALTVWKSKGAPPIHAPDGDILDLAKFLAAPGAPESHLQAVRAWLEKQTDKPRGES